MYFLLSLYFTSTKKSIESLIDYNGVVSCFIGIFVWSACAYKIDQFSLIKKKILFSKNFWFSLIDFVIFFLPFVHLLQDSQGPPVQQLTIFIQPCSKNSRYGGQGGHFPWVISIDIFLLSSDLHHSYINIYNILRLSYNIFIVIVNKSIKNIVRKKITYTFLICNKTM